LPILLGLTKRRPFVILSEVEGSSLLKSSRFLDKLGMTVGETKTPSGKDEGRTIIAQAES
jgi:hypothetical protein